MEMNFDNFKEQLFAAGKKQGYSQMEVFEKKSHSFNLRVFEQEVDHYAINEEQGLGLRALIDGKMGYAFTEKMDEESLDILIKDVAENAEVIEKEEEEIFTGQEEYRDLDPYNSELNQVKPEEKIKLVKELEKEALERDERVRAVNYCLYTDLEFEEKLVNTGGLNLSFKNNIAYCYISVIASDGNQTKTASRYFLTGDFDEFTPQSLAREAADEALGCLGASPVPSGEYRVIFRNDVAADLLSAFSGTLSAENVQKNLSLFRDKLGEEVASDTITLIDDPFLKKGFRVCPFDAEGASTYQKNVIENGVLKTFLHNQKTASRAGVSTTGNAYRGSHKSYIDIAPSNMYIKPGSYSRQELLSSTEHGLFITEVQGLHAGANSVSGDFSLSASGFLMENGDRKQPVEQITIAGNFLDMLKKITMVGEDLKMGLPGSSHLGAPSIKVSSLSVAGE